MRINLLQYPVMEYRSLPDFQPHLKVLPYRGDSGDMRIPSDAEPQSLSDGLKDRPYVGKHPIAVCKQESLSFIELPNLRANGQVDYNPLPGSLQCQGAISEKINGRDTLSPASWTSSTHSDKNWGFHDQSDTTLTLSVDRELTEGQRVDSTVYRTVEPETMQGILEVPVPGHSQVVGNVDQLPYRNLLNESEPSSPTRIVGSLKEPLTSPRSPELPGLQRRISQSSDKEKLARRKMKVYSPESSTEEPVSSPSLTCESIFSGTVFDNKLKNSDGVNCDLFLDESEALEHKTSVEASDAPETSEHLAVGPANHNCKGPEQERRRFSASELINKLQLSQRKSSFTLKLGKSLSTRVTPKEKGTPLSTEVKQTGKSCPVTPTESPTQSPPPLGTVQFADSFLQHKGTTRQRIDSLEEKLSGTHLSYERRHSRFLPNSVLYQEYSDVAINREIQRQKREDAIVEEDDVIIPPKSNLSPTNSFRSQRSSRGSTFSLWQDIPDVRSSGLLDTFSNQERKLQEAKFELITSEASYIRSLSIAVDHFMNSKELNECLGTQEKQWLFSKLPDVKEVSERFLLDLEERLEADILRFDVCDIVLDHCPEFQRVYLPYVTNQAYQELTYQRLLQENPKFPSILAKLEEDQMCQRLPLTSFLILPFQRITRLKMLVENILKRTTQGSRDEDTATKAFNELKRLIRECNASVQSMKRTEELIHLNKKIHFESKIFPLISQSRWLVKHGELVEVDTQATNMTGSKFKVATRPVYLHLFNDCLLLSRKKETGKFAVFAHAKIQELKVKDLNIKLHGIPGHIFHLQLSENHQIKYQVLLRAQTESEKQRWITAMFPSSHQTEKEQAMENDDCPQVQCIKAYKAQEHDELSLEKADILEVKTKTSDGWIEGMRLSDGERGWFPKAYVEEIISRNARLRNLRENNRIKCATLKLEEEQL
ncbi:rho guanine nucleotide exchange factor 19 [Latimeria chalumnae]|uniref:rho guanine nucleotide exchange factor 19 n=1 Tax=Latimeria chalumnae TaxID=7897 RepID=UPI00313C002D